MGWTKRDFVLAAFEEAGLAAYVFDLTADELQSALRKLDSMMATWNAKGIRLGYPIPSSPTDSDLDQDSGVPDAANEAIYTNLAMKIATGYGKQILPDTKISAKLALDTLYAIAGMPPEQQLPGTMPLGAGHLPHGHHRNFADMPQQPLLAGQDGEIILE